MKITVLNLILILVTGLFSVTRTTAQSAQYTPGSVWQISMVKTKANMSVEYLNSLKTTWKAIHDEAKAQGLILSYMILDGGASNPGDFDVMLMVEVKDYATIEANHEKWEAVRKKVMPDENAMKQLNQARVSIRDIYGDKMMREVIYK